MENREDGWVDKEIKSGRTDGRSDGCGDGQLSCGHCLHMTEQSVGLSAAAAQ